MVRSPTPGAFPRLRGKLDLLEPEDIFLGCIPAPAGETPVDHCGVPYPAVHPRACGGNQEVGAAAPLIPGASPRLRGKQLGAERGAGPARCIPAPAGETDEEDEDHPFSPVHPRACGGNGIGGVGAAARVGASPRLRGKPSPAESRSCDIRCIPAPAGETAPSSTSSGPSAVHPRACGGNDPGPDSYDGELGASPRLRGKRGPGSLRRPFRGASPRLRGKLFRGKKKMTYWRCIPAPAGETRSLSRFAPILRVHPRACGGNNRANIAGCRARGASPRLRGKHRRGGGGGSGRGCIPAPAGETGGTPRRAEQRWVHPRACGGNLGARRGAADHRGASPRLRGKRQVLEVLDGLGRCIPAPAGETRRWSGAPPSAWVHPRACGGN